MCKVILALDDARVSAELTDLLEQDGFEVVHASTVGFKNAPVVAIVDLWAKDQVRAWRARGARVVATTGFIDDDAWDDAQELGADALAETPLDEHGFVELTRRLAAA